jgi:hypothetical protein
VAVALWQEEAQGCTVIVVDRIEGDRAILEVDGDTIELPLSVLPPGAGEGTILTLVLCGEQGSDLSKENEERLARLRAADPGDMEIEI